MTTPTQQILQRGSYANDGTGDTLRDAGQKINDNFTYLWEEVWNAGSKPGREFLCKSVSTSSPAEGEFTIFRSSLEGDSDQWVRISRWDQDDKSFKTSATATHATSLSLWSLDSGTIDDWNYIARYEGNLQYVTDHWIFEKTSTTHATSDLVDSGGTYYIKVDGAW